jgi:hypothetical protein
MADDDQCYYFDGSAGCDACDAMTGYYADAPCGPHRYCNCPVEEVSADVEYVLKNVTWHEYGSHVEKVEALDNCDGDEAAHMQMAMGAEEEENFDEGLREAAEEAGWKEPEEENMFFEVAVPPHSSGDVTIVMERYAAELQAEVWAVHADGSEEYVGDATGYFEKNINVERADLAGESCGHLDLDRWLPRPDEGGEGEGEGGDDSDFPDV